MAVKLKNSLLLPLLCIVIVGGATIAFLTDDRRISEEVRDQVDENRQKYLETLLKQNDSALALVLIDIPKPLVRVMCLTDEEFERQLACFRYDILLQQLIEHYERRDSLLKAKGD